MPVDGLDKKLAGLSPAKRALLDRMRKQAAARSTIAPPIRPRPSGAVAPLSFSQQRLWLIHQLDPQSHLYNVPRAVRMKGCIQPALLQTSLNEIVRRHEVLRTTFVAQVEQPVQKVAEQLHVALPITDLSALETSKQESEIRRLGLEEYRKPFDLAAGPLIRARLIRLSESDHVLVLVMHHIVSDGWTGGLLFEELGALYASQVSGTVSQLPELAIQYADYSTWQREWIKGPVLDNALAFWREHLDGAPAVLELPFDRPRAERSNYRGRKTSLLLSQTLSEELKSFSQQHAMTMFATMMAGLKILLYRWGGQEDLVVGTVSANRNQVEVEKLIGCFMNFLVLRDTISADNSGDDFLLNVNQTILAGFGHQECPFEKLIEALNPQRAMNVNPLYNVALLMQNFPEMAFRTPTLEARFIDLETEVAFLDLRYVASETASGIHIECEYNSDLFDAETVEQTLKGYRSVLEQLVRQPQTKLADFQIPEALTAQARVAKKREAKQTIAISSTFTAEPVEEPLEFWMRQLGIRSRIEFAPYNQVFQQLLDPSSLTAQNSSGVNVMLVRLEDWAGQHGDSPDGRREIERNVRELSDAIHRAVERSTTPYIVCVCPPSPGLLATSESAEFFRSMEGLLLGLLKDVPGVHLATSSELSDLYPVKNYYDEYAEKLGRIPYTPEFFTALGTMIARRMHGIRRAPHKVIVLDCDNTFWKGVCGEEGPLGVTVDTAHRALQEFIIAQHQAGMVLCLCSKNVEEDVTAVFEKNPGMRMKREH